MKLEGFEVPSMANEFDRYKAKPAPCAFAPVPSNEWIAPKLSHRQFLLSEIPPETLLEMCEDFKKEVFKRAGKSTIMQEGGPSSLALEVESLRGELIHTQIVLARIQDLSGEIGGFVENLDFDTTGRDAALSTSLEIGNRIRDLNLPEFTQG
tara:strand:- start:1598 stop:2053 length:456 start_codon:yes stop_codon:yes gene_type:complete